VAPGLNLSTAQPLGSLLKIYNLKVVVQNLASSFPFWRLGFTMNEAFNFSCFLVLFVFFSLSNGLKVPFERRAVRGAQFRSPYAATRYSFGAVEAEAVVNRMDLRVDIFFEPQIFMLIIHLVCDEYHN
jgi:hypothetical protein